MTRSRRNNIGFFTASAALLVLSLLVASGQLDEAAAVLRDQNEPRSLVAAARNIDRLVQVDLKKHNVAPNRMSSDSSFLRRVYLDVVGRIPDVKETRTFLNSRNPNKRVELIDTLMTSPGYVSHNFNYWADILRAKTRLNQQVSGEPFMHWIKQSLQDNKPYDTMVHEMLTAEGAANERGNGATGFLLRDRNMPLDSMANTMRVFLGTRIECAQCHNHPNAAWTQRQFFEVAAFFGGLQYQNPYASTQEGRKLFRQIRSVQRTQGEQVARQLRRQFRRVLQPGLNNSGTGVTRLPNDYQYEDGKPNDFILAKTIFGKPADLDPEVPRISRRAAERMKKANNPRARRRTMAPDINSRKAFADWVTDTENELFTTVIANRLWQKLMGTGLVPNVDDLREEVTSVNPELSAFLDQLMRDLNYDLKAFQKVILLTDTYQREASSSLPPAGQRYRFPGPVTRRMTAEQMWDSMLTLVVPAIDSTIDEPMNARAKSIYDSYEDLSTKSAQQIMAQFSGGDGAMNPQQLRRQKQQELREKIRPIRRELIRARRRGDKEAEKAAQAKLTEMGVDLERTNAQRRFGRDLLRASELPSPTPAGHLLREFGQSDRDTADGGSLNASVPQVLNLVNGFVEKNLLAKDQGMMMTAIRKAKGSSQKIRTAFLFILNRQPTAAELAMWKKEAQKLGDAAYDDLIWTLVNCHEFRQVS